MTEDLIARLKAAHEAGTPGPWEWSHDTGHRYMHMRAKAGLTGAVGDARLFLGCFSDDSLDSADAALFTLVRNALPAIIAALEERERLMGDKKQVRSALLYLVGVVENITDNWPDPVKWDELAMSMQVAREALAATFVQGEAQR